MDAIDRAILQELKANGKATASEISKKVNLSIPAVTERIHKMEKTEIIQQYTIRVNREKTDQKLLAFIFVYIDKNENAENFRKAIVQYDCVLECHHVCGSYDYILKVVTAGTRTLEDFLSNTLKKMGVNSTNTIITLITLKEEINF